MSNYIIVLRNGVKVQLSLSGRLLQKIRDRFNNNSAGEDNTASFPRDVRDFLTMYKEQGKVASSHLDLCENSG
jgi:hypothetical protein